MFSIRFYTQCYKHVYMYTSPDKVLHEFSADAGESERRQRQAVAVTNLLGMHDIKRVRLCLSKQKTRIIRPRYLS